MPFEGCFVEQARARFAAGAMVVILMWANEDVVQRKGGAQDLMHLIHVTPGQITARNFRLICGGDENKAGGLESL